MTHDSANGNAAASDPSVIGPDAHGHAALLLVESLVHGLIARSALTLAEAIEIVEIAADAREEVALTHGGSARTLQTSKNLLRAISESLRLDLV